MGKNTDGAEQLGANGFQKARLQSERLRVLAVLAMIAIVLAVSLLRVFVFRTVSLHAALARGVAFFSMFAVFELWVLRRLSVAIKAQQKVSSCLRVAIALFEVSIPGLAIVLLASDEIQPAYQPLASPVVLLFFILISLSTLTLSRSICWWSGAIAAGSYIGAAMYLGWRVPVPGSTGSLARSYVSIYALALLLAGSVASVVAGQIRKYLDAALREAQTRSCLEALEHDLQVARTIQQSLLPNRPPHLKQFDIAGWNKPATETGGDYFDWMTLDNGRVVITLGDVTGHGIGPALLAAVCRAYSRAALMTERDLSRAFVTINESLNRDLTPERFVTFAAAACIPETGEIELLSAGHGPLVIYSRSQDRFSELKPQGTPLGILPCFNSEAPASLRMEAGDLVLLATDGFIEWQDERGEEFGLHRLEEAMRGSRDLSASDIIARLYDCVISFSHGTGQADDLTAVVIKRL